MANWDKEYIKLCKKILEEGTLVQNRTGTDSIKIPGYFLEFDLQKEFPVLTTKKLYFKNAITEILWIYQAKSNDVRWLKERGNHIWDEWEIDDDGILVFEDLTGKVIKKYDNIESKVISIDSTNDKCDLIYVAVTEDGKVYKTEEEDGLFSGEPFLMIPLEEEYSKISLYNESCDLKLIGLNKNNEVKDLLVNE